MNIINYVYLEAHLTSHEDTVAHIIDLIFVLSVNLKLLATGDSIMVDKHTLYG